MSSYFFQDSSSEPSSVSLTEARSDSSAEDEPEISFSCEPFDRTGDILPVDYAAPVGKNNLRVVHRELADDGDDGDYVRSFQRELMVAVRDCDKRNTASCVGALARSGRARNFMAIAGSLLNGAETGRVQDRDYESDFDGPLLDTILNITCIPRDMLTPLQLLIASVDIDDPLLLTVALDCGADPNDSSLRVTPLHNASARHQDALVQILQRHGAS